MITKRPTLDYHHNEYNTEYHHAWWQKTWRSSWWVKGHDHQHYEQRSWSPVDVRQRRPLFKHTSTYQIASLPILQSVPRPHVKKYILYVFCERSKVFRMIDYNYLLKSLSQVVTVSWTLRVLDKKIVPLSKKQSLNNYHQ